MIGHVMQRKRFHLLMKSCLSLPSLGIRECGVRGVDAIAHPLRILGVVNIGILN